MIKVLLADDHAIIRLILRQILEIAKDIQIVSIVSDGQQAVNEAFAQRPDVAVIDVSMPIMDGVEATKQICSNSLETRVLIISTHDTPYHIRRSIKAGASGYVLKDEISRELVTAIRTLHQGKRYFSQQITELAKFYLELQVR